MRYSQLFGKTTKTIAEDDKIVSSKLLYQAGYVRESTAGRMFMLPLGIRVQQKVMKIVKEEMDASGAQEMVSPFLHPLELWKETNRTNTTGFELMKVVDRRGAEFALGGTAEEMFVDVVRKFNISYRDLPFHIYQFSTKFRDELRARGGLLRVREFIMKDGYTFDRNEQEFKKTYDEMALVYKKIFDRLDMKTVKVESDNGYIGGEYCHEFIVEHPIGESKFLMTQNGEYAAHVDVARFVKEKMNAHEKLLPLQEIDAVRGTTMEDGQKLHGLPLWQQIKDVLYVDEKGRFILAVIRGDFEVNEMKLCHVAGSITLRHATVDEIRDICHTAAGFISPVKLREKIKKGTTLVIVADDSLRTVVNAYGGANALNRDLLNVNIDRDYQADLEGDIALAEEGYLAEDNGLPLIEKRGIEVGNIFQLGYHYTKKMKNANYIDSDGKEKPYYMGCYGIGIGRTIAAIVETHHDDRGIIWPANVAPYDVHLIGLDLKDDDVKRRAENLYHTLIEQGFDVLYDDRIDGAQVEFKKRGDSFPVMVEIDKLTSLL
jgi:prolyl-tRNA synthetase